MTGTIQALREKVGNGTGKMSIRSLAKKLGMNDSSLVLIFSGKRKPGMKFVRAVLREFPELTGTVLNDLQVGAQV